MTKEKTKNIFWLLVYIMPILIWIVCILNKNYTFNTIQDVFGQFSYLAQQYNFGTLQSTMHTLFNQYLGIANSMSHILSFLSAYYIVIVLVRILCDLFSKIYTMFRG